MVDVRLSYSLVSFISNPRLPWLPFSVDEDEQPNEDGEVFIYRYSEDAEGNPSLENIEDDEEYEVVSDRFDELLDEAEFEDLDD